MTSPLPEPVPDPAPGLAAAPDTALFTPPGPEAAQAARLATGAFARPILAASLWQLANSAAGFAAACALMYWSLKASYLLTLVLAVPAAGFLVRLFIIQHDCGHGAFFRANWANEAVGRVCAMLTLTPFRHWRRQHAIHHGRWNNLDRVEGADMYSDCLTLAAYRALSPAERRRYRLSHHPVFTLLLLPPVLFLLLYRIPFDTPRAWRRERFSVYLTNAAILAVIAGLGAALGFGRVAAVQLPVMILAAIIGVWLFSVQHRFAGSLWAHDADWDAGRAAIAGASYLRLPALLHWFTGNIGFHHIHHLNPRVPNYRLRACHEASPLLRAMPGLSLAAACRAHALTLWDEERQRQTGFPAER